MKTTSIVFLIGIVSIVGLAAWGLTSLDSGPAVEAIGILNDPITNSSSVEPGKYKVNLPFTLKNLSLDTKTFNVRLEPGTEGTVMVVIREEEQGQVRVELATKVELR